MASETTAKTDQMYIEIRPQLPPPPPPPPPELLFPPPPPPPELLIPPPPSRLQQPPPPPPRLSVEITAEEFLKEQKVRFPFFEPIRQRRENYWVISFFVMLHLVTFAATMITNDCWHHSHSHCFFQSLSENPLLGPSASALDDMGALRQNLLVEHHQFWRLYTSILLHAGLFHLIINLSSVVLVGIHLEQEFGPLRIGIVYMLSAITGSLVAVLFIQDRPSVASSGALFGLLGTMLSGLIQNWKFYTKKFAALVAFLIILTINLILGLMPYVNNFSNIGGFLAGILIGFVLLFKPQLGKVAQNKAGLFDYDVKHAVRLRHKLDKPILRSVSLVIFGLLFAGVTVAVFRGTKVNKYCSWCKFLDCVPSKWWSCSNKSMHCETMVNSDHLTLTCSGSGKFKVFPFTDISQVRIEDLCYMICS